MCCHVMTVLRAAPLCVVYTHRLGVDMCVCARARGVACTMHERIVCLAHTTACYRQRVQMLEGQVEELQETVLNLTLTTMTTGDSPDVQCVSRQTACTLPSAQGYLVWVCERRTVTGREYERETRYTSAEWVFLDTDGSKGSLLIGSLDSSGGYIGCVRSAQCSRGTRPKETCACAHKHACMSLH